MDSEDVVQHLLNLMVFSKVVFKVNTRIQSEKIFSELCMCPHVLHWHDIVLYVSH